ncbi:MAG: hypothetical protein AAF721_21120, partial [Myxococcota bacterium]
MKHGLVSSRWVLGPLTFLAVGACASGGNNGPTLGTIGMMPVTGAAPGTDDGPADDDGFDDDRFDDDDVGDDAKEEDDGDDRSDETDGTDGGSETGDRDDTGDGTDTGTDDGGDPEPMLIHFNSDGAILSSGIDDAPQWVSSLVNGDEDIPAHPNNGRATQILNA